MKDIVFTINDKSECNEEDKHIFCELFSSIILKNNDEKTIHLLRIKVEEKFTFVEFIELLEINKSIENLQECFFEIFERIKSYNNKLKSINLIKVFNNIFLSLQKNFPAFILNQSCNLYQSKRYSAYINSFLNSLDQYGGNKEELLMNYNKLSSFINQNILPKEINKDYYEINVDDISDPMFYYKGKLYIEILKIVENNQECLLSSVFLDNKILFSKTGKKLFSFDDVVVLIIDNEQVYGFNENGEEIYGYSNQYGVFFYNKKGIYKIDDKRSDLIVDLAKYSGLETQEVKFFDNNIIYFSIDDIDKNQVFDYYGKRKEDEEEKYRYHRYIKFFNSSGLLSNIVPEYNSDNKVIMNMSKLRKLIDEYSENEILEIRFLYNALKDSYISDDYDLSKYIYLMFNLAKKYEAHFLLLFREKSLDTKEVFSIILKILINKYGTSELFMKIRDSKKLENEIREYIRMNWKNN